MTQNQNELVRRAKAGDRAALEELVIHIQDRIYGLALKMLYMPQDAEDATQEILIKIVTRLGSFKHKSSFDTWALKAASNHLLSKRKSLAKTRFTFERCESMIIMEAPDQSSVLYSEAEQAMVVKEMRLSCMQGLLQCLDWDHRIVYILGETMDVTGPEGAAILDIRRAAFRKRLSRARERVRDFVARNCELYDEINPCKCAIQAAKAVSEGYINPNSLPLAEHPAGAPRDREALKGLETLEGLSRAAAIMRAHPDYAAPGDFVEGIRNMLDSYLSNQALGA